MSKVLITKEEKESLDCYIAPNEIKEDFEYFMRNKDDFGEEFKPLSRFTDEEFALILLGHYKVASNVDLHDFQIGDLIETVLGSHVKIVSVNMIDWAIERRNQGDIVKIYPVGSVIED